MIEFRSTGRDHEICLKERYGILSSNPVTQYSKRYSIRIINGYFLINFNNIKHYFRLPRPTK